MLPGEMLAPIQTPKSIIPAEAKRRNLPDAARI